MSGDAEPQVDVARESRRGRWAGLAALTAVGCLFGALIAAANASPADVTGPLGQEEQEGGIAEALQEYDDALGTQALALGFKLAGFGLMIPVLLFICEAVRGRKPDTNEWLGRLAVVGGLLIVLSSIGGYFALMDVADTFTDSGAQTDRRAEDVAEDSAALRLTSLFEILARLVFAACVAWMAYAAMQVGLVTRFVGLIGIGAGVAFGVLLPGADALIAVFLGGIGLMAMDRWPGGRPAAWDTGRAAPQALDPAPRR